MNIVLDTPEKIAANDHLLRVEYLTLCLAAAKEAINNSNPPHLLYGRHRETTDEDIALATALINSESHSSYQ